MMGWCHLCCRIQLVKYCGVCGHWLCDECRRDIKGRVVAFMDELMNGATTDCCGPFKEE